MDISHRLFHFFYFSATHFSCIHSTIEYLQKRIQHNGKATARIYTSESGTLINT